MTEDKIEFRHVWKVYADREQEALETILVSRAHGRDVSESSYVVGVDDASFTITKGEVFCIIGLSGSGKSTLLRHINGLIRPTAGDVFIDGQAVNALAGEALRELRLHKISMVFQHVALLPNRTVGENVAFGLEVRGLPKVERRRQALAALQRVRLDGWEEYYPDELSGGMQQRVGLARAMVTEPEILLMDEPFSALDPLIRRELQDQFLELSARATRTTVFITHDIDEAVRLGDRIAIMNKGRIEQIGTPQDILLRPATNYVARFVAHVPLMDKLVAADIMKPVDGGGQPDAARSVQSAAPLSVVLSRSIGSEGTLHVVDGGTFVGTIERADVLTFLSSGPKVAYSGPRRHAEQPAPGMTT